MNFVLSKEQLIIQNVAQEFAEKQLKPVADLIEKENRIPEDIAQSMRDLDFFALPYDEKLGGAGAGYDGYVLVVEQLAKVSRGASSLLSAHTLCLGAITNFGNEEMLKKYLEPCCKGEWIGSFAFTEPATGSDPKQITTTAVRDGDHFIINGTKRFISNAVYKGPIVVFAKDVISGKPTAFVVDKFCPGYSVSEPWAKMGTHGQVLVDVYLQDVRVPASNMLGELGQGYPILQYGISYGKIGLSANALGSIGSSLKLKISSPFTASSTSLPDLALFCPRRREWRRKRKRR